VPTPYPHRLPLLLAIAATTLPAQSPPHPPEIVTDRPDITEAAIVVPKGSLQFENGLAWTIDHGRNTFDLTQTLVRIGITRRTELRAGVPDFLAVWELDHQHGFGDVSAGVKRQLGPLPGRIDLAVIAGISFPTGAEAQSSHGYDPFVKFPWSRELAGGWSVGGMFSGFWYTQDHRRRFYWEPAIYLEREITTAWEAFAEYAGDFPTHTGARHVLHLGTAYKVTPVHQLDFHIGFGLNSNTPERFIAAGYSFRVDNLFVRHHP
jgi:Putative MetA-pathway of phenol degradation